MPIELDVQINVPDESREKLLLLFQQAVDDIKKYYADNPSASPDYPLDDVTPNNGRVQLFYHIVSAPEPFRNGIGNFSFQTVGATTQQQSFLFGGATSVMLLISATNAGNTKGLAAYFQFNSTVMNNNAVTTNQATDFGTANASIAIAANTVTITLTGEAGETIDWKGSFQVATV